MKNVTRLTHKNLHQIASGDTLKEAICIIKFYSSKCSFCHNLKDAYTALADSFEDDPDIYFFVYNVDGVPSKAMPKQIEINGVPTICRIETGQKNPKIKILDEPAEPDKLTWYHPKDMLRFVGSSAQKREQK